MMAKLILTRDAKNDALEVSEWYETRTPGTGERFLKALEGKFDAIQMNPKIHRILPGSNIRKTKIENWPYQVFFVPEQSIRPGDRHHPHFPGSLLHLRKDPKRPMTLRQFYDWQTEGGAKDVSRLVAALEEREISWCMIGGLAVNHWAEEPMTTADVDLVIASEKVEGAAETLKSLGFSEKRLDSSINFKGKSKVSIQVSTEEMYLDFPERAVPANVHGILMKVASLEDTLAGKLAAYLEPQRRPTKKLKDILDIARLVDAHPELAEGLPEEVRDRLNP